MARHSRGRVRHSKATILATQLKMRNCGAALDTVMSMPKGTEKRAATAAFKLACVVSKKRAVADLKDICGTRKVSKRKRKSGLAGVIDGDNGTPFDGLGAARKKRKKAKRKVARRRKKKFADYISFSTPSRRENAAYRFLTDEVELNPYRYHYRDAERPIRTSDPLRQAVRRFIRGRL
jgi:hypothetical protein